jgi:hypothetical protein
VLQKGAGDKYGKGTVLQAHLHADGIIVPVIETTDFGKQVAHQHSQVIQGTGIGKEVSIR